MDDDTTSTPPARAPTFSEQLETALREVFSAEVSVQFETAPELVGGIELVTSGQKLAWSIHDYLSTLEQSVGELLAKKGEVQAHEHSA
jgi:F-type H+-transporting ATPase subunit b